MPKMNLQIRKTPLKYWVAKSGVCSGPEKSTLGHFKGLGP